MLFSGKLPLEEREQAHHFGGDLSQLQLAQGLKHDHVIQPVQELWPEVLLDHAHDQVLCHLAVAVLQQQV